MQEMQETWVWPVVGKIWSRKWQPTPVFLPGNFIGQRSLVGYSPGVAKSQIWLSNWAHTCRSLKTGSYFQNGSSVCLSVTVLILPSDRIWAGCSWYIVIKEYQIEHFSLNSMGVRPPTPHAIESLRTTHHLPSVSAGPWLLVQPAAECAVVTFSQPPSVGLSRSASRRVCGCVGFTPGEHLCAPVTCTAQTHVVQASAVIWSEVGQLGFWSTNFNVFIYETFIIYILNSTLIYLTVCV